MAPQIPPLDQQQPEPVVESPDNAVVIVTPYSTGCCVALEMQQKGYKLICLWSAGFSEAMKLHVPVSCRGKLAYDAVIDEADTIEETASTIASIAAKNHWNIVACVCGGEAGVDTADALSEHMGLVSNGTDIPNRRDKQVQQELAKAAGLRSVRQAGGQTFEQVHEFLCHEKYPLIVKPLDSAGSDGVKLCYSYEEAKEHVLHLLGSEMVNGGLCTDVLCQEYLKGKEYVVDHVSCNGVHKTVMVWVYDKRAVNGASFVYFGDIPIDSASPEAQLLIPYVRGVLDALGVKHGPSHGEVIMTEDGPCLVEMNVRTHGGDGIWRPLCQAMLGGYDQVSATVDAYLDEEAFSALPDKPVSPMLAAGQCVDLVSFSEGTVESTPGYDVIRSLPSFVALESHIKQGTKVHKTVDIATDAGSLVAVNSDKEQLQKDIETIRKLEKDNMLFTYKKEAPLDTVVVVTPYSTGCHVALDMKKQGYKLICLWSAGFSDAMKLHVPVACRSQLSYDAIIDEAATIEETASLVRQVAKKNNWNVMACVCGGEAGVDTADALSEHMGLLSNGTDVPNRRDKKVQQELAKAAGLRSVRQAAGKNFDQVDTFLQKERYPLIVKPLDSAGSDGVKLCHTYEEAKKHVLALLGSEMVNGGLCTDVLCQEYLKGKEYVVDHVSCNGVHKTVMVWVYDKRAVNGASFVYFGDLPVDSESPEAKLLIPYVRGVLDSLGVRNGPSHGEVIMTEDGPCLVEMNVRTHGGDGIWRPLCKALLGGYDQVSATVDAYVNKEAFDTLPDKPVSPMLAAGQCVDLVSFFEGKVKSTPGYNLIRSLPSFVKLETHIGPGSQVVKTVDIATDAGSVVVLNSDPAILKRDIAIIRQLEKTGSMFEFEDEWDDKRLQFLQQKTMSLDFHAGPTRSFSHRRLVAHERKNSMFAMPFEGL